MPATTQKRERMHRHLRENRDRKIQFNELLHETGINRKAALETLAQLRALGIAACKRSGGKSLWYWQSRDSSLDVFMRTAKNRAGITYISGTIAGEHAPCT